MRLIKFFALNYVLFNQTMACNYQRSTFSDSQNPNLTYAIDVDPNVDDLEHCLYLGNTALVDPTLSFVDEIKAGKLCNGTNATSSENDWEEFWSDLPIPCQENAKALVASRSRNKTSRSDFDNCVISGFSEITKNYAQQSAACNKKTIIRVFEIGGPIVGVLCLLYCYLDRKKLAKRYCSQQSDEKTRLNIQEDAKASTGGFFSKFELPQTTSNSSLLSNAF